MGPDAVRERFTAVAGHLLAELSQRLDWSPEQVDAHQRDALRATLQHAAARSPWYAERLAGIDPSTATVGELRAVPPMTKADLMAHWDRIVCVDGLALAACEAALADGRVVVDGEHLTMTSSGSSGRRAVMAYSVAELATEWAVYLRLLLRWAAQHGQAGVPRTALVGAPPGPHISAVIGWLQGVDDSGLFSVDDPLDEVLVPGLNTVDPELLVVYPSVLPALLRAARDGRLRICPKLVLTIAEPVLAEQVTQVRAIWGSAVSPNWATTELGVLGTGDATDDGLVLHDDHTVVEAVDRDGKPVADGALADKVLVTTLSRRTLPLVRYEVTDQLTVLGRAHGEPLRRAGGVQGRLDDAFRYGDRILHPSAVRNSLAAPGVDDYQVHQTNTGVRILVVGNDRLDAPSVSRAVSDALRRIGLQAPEVEITAVTGLRSDPRSGKLRRFVPFSSPAADAVPASVGADQ